MQYGLAFVGPLDMRALYVWEELSALSGPQRLNTAVWDQLVVL